MLTSLALMVTKAYIKYLHNSPEWKPMLEQTHQDMIKDGKVDEAAMIRTMINEPYIVFSVWDFLNVVQLATLNRDMLARLLLAIEATAYGDLEDGLFQTFQFIRLQGRLLGLVFDKDTWKASIKGWLSEEARDQSIGIFMKYMEQGAVERKVNEMRMSA